MAAWHGRTAADVADRGVVSSFHPIICIERHCVSGGLSEGADSLGKHRGGGGDGPAAKTQASTTLAPHPLLSTASLQV